MKDTQMPPAYTTNLVANSGSTVYWVENVKQMEHIFTDKKTSFKSDDNTRCRGLNKYIYHNQDQVQRELTIWMWDTGCFRPSVSI